MRSCSVDDLGEGADKSRELCEFSLRTSYTIFQNIALIHLILDDKKVVHRKSADYFTRSPVKAAGYLLYQILQLWCRKVQGKCFFEGWRCWKAFEISNLYRICRMYKNITYINLTDYHNYKKNNCSR